MFCRFHMFFSDTFWKLPKSTCSFKFFTQRKKHFLVSYFVSIIYLVLNVILLNNKTAPAISPMQCPFVHKYFPCWSVDKREGMLWISMGQTVTGGHHSSILETWILRKLENYCAQYLSGCISFNTFTQGGLVMWYHTSLLR